MSAVKTVACGAFVWAALVTVVKADRISAGGSDPNGGWLVFRGAGGRGYFQVYPTFRPADVSTNTPPASPPAPANIPTPGNPPTLTTFSAPTMGMATASGTFSTPSGSSPTSATPGVTGGAAGSNYSTISIGSVSAPINTAPAQNGAADAFLNFGTSGYLEAADLTVGNPGPWYNSPTVSKVYGGQPSASQQADFTSKVLGVVEKTFSLSGLSPKITLDPNTPANHTMSVVSGASYGPNANAIGITDVGHNGFGFIDKLNYASNPDELAQAVGHNIAHELMHAFGVGNHPDTTGNFVDAGTASWSLLTNPDATFSPAAAKAINDNQFGAFASGTTGTQLIDGDQEILAVPEPATVVTWALGAAGALFAARRRARRAA